MDTSVCHSVISQMINFFVVCCFVNPGSDPSSDPGSDPSSDPGSDPGFILSLSRKLHQSFELIIERPKSVLSRHKQLLCPVSRCVSFH